MLDGIDLNGALGRYGSLEQNFEEGKQVFHQCSDGNDHYSDYQRNHLVSMRDRKRLTRERHSNDMSRLHWWRKRATTDYYANTCTREFYIPNFGYNLKDRSCDIQPVVEEEAKE